MARWLVFAALAGCGHAAPPSRSSREIARTPADAAPPDAAALDDDMPRLAARSSQLFQDLAAALVDANDCNAAADKLEALTTSYAAVIAADARMTRASRDRTRAFKDALQPHEVALGVAMHAIADAPIVKQCARDTRFSTAIDRLQGAS